VGATPASVDLARNSSAEVPVASLKVQAANAIPAIRARIQAWNAGKGAPEFWSGTVKYGAEARDRNTVYSTLWQQLEPNNGRYWFQAAAMVTGRGGIKSMEGRLPGFGIAAMPSRFVPVKAADADFLIKGNQFLFPYNLANFYTLRAHQSVPGFPHFWGRELDRALVVVEQTLVQTFIDSYGWTTATEKFAALDRISRSFTALGANEWVKNVLLGLFSSVRPFKFGSLDHRVEFGIKIVDELRAGR